jgi:hypothetical protein
MGVSRSCVPEPIQPTRKLPGCVALLERGCSNAGMTLSTGDRKRQNERCSRTRPPKDRARSWN